MIMPVATQYLSCHLASLDPPITKCVCCVCALFVASHLFFLVKGMQEGTTLYQGHVLNVAQYWAQLLLLLLHSVALARTAGNSSYTKNSCQAYISTNTSSTCSTVSAAEEPLSELPKSTTTTNWLDQPIKVCLVFLSSKALVFDNCWPLSQAGKLHFFLRCERQAKSMFFISTEVIAQTSIATQRRSWSKVFVY